MMTSVNTESGARRITKDFSLEEFTDSEKARKNGIQNTPSPEHIQNIKLLCVKLLQPLRYLYGSPMHINSGFRCKELNDILPDSSDTSDHMNGLAADIRCKSPKKLLEVLLASNLIFDQAILYPTFLHLSYRPINNRNQVIYK